MSKITDLEKRLELVRCIINGEIDATINDHWMLEVKEKKQEEPKQDEPTMDDLGENIERVVLTKKEVRYMEDLEKRLTALEKKQEEPKQDEPEIVYGSTVSVRDQKIKKLFDDLDKELSITHDGNANSRTHLFIVLEKYKEKLNKIFGKEI